MIEHPELRVVVPPTTWDGVPKAGAPRMRHLSGDCQHFTWPHGIVGTPQPATDDEMRALPPCSDCVARHGQRTSLAVRSAPDRPIGATCASCFCELPVTGQCDNCD
mgnify:CR=1 FL=1